MFSLNHVISLKLSSSCVVFQKNKSTIFCKRLKKVLRFNFRVRFKVEEWLIGGIPLKFEWMKINTYGDNERVFNIAIAGGVFRDYTGACLHGFDDNIGVCSLIIIIF